MNDNYFMLLVVCIVLIVVVLIGYLFGWTYDSECLTKFAKAYCDSMNLTFKDFDANNRMFSCMNSNLRLPSSVQTFLFLENETNTCYHPVRKWGNIKQAEELSHD